MSTKKLQLVGSIVTTDETLTQSGVPADAKAVGDALDSIEPVCATDDGNGVITIGGLTVPEDSSDEWILIADVTTTEGVNYFQFTTDADGNSFVCKRIVANLIMPEAPTSAGVTISVNPNGSQYSGEIFSNNINSSCLRYFVNVELIPNAVIFEFAENNNTLVNQDMTVGKYLLETELTKLTRFGIADGWNGTETFPVGTQLKVWGLK